MSIDLEKTQQKVWELSIGVSALNDDINHLRKQIESRLQNLEFKLRILFAATGIGIGILFSKLVLH